MAGNNITPHKDLIDNGGDVTIGRARVLIASEATWEIEKLCSLLRTVCKPSDEMENLAIRGLSARIDELNHIIMGAISDSAELTKDLAYRLRLNGEEIPA